MFKVPFKSLIESGATVELSSILSSKNVGLNNDFSCSLTIIFITFDVDFESSSIKYFVLLSIILPLSFRYDNEYFFIISYVFPSFMLSISFLITFSNK